MQGIWAIARLMVAESIRRRIAILFIAVQLGLLAVLPFVVDGDGVTLRSRVQSCLAYALGAVGLLLSLLTVFLSCAAVADEIRNKTVFTVVSKPLSRWKLVAGKWLGIMLLNAALLGVTLLAVSAAVWYLARQPTSVPGDREALQFEVLSVRHGTQPSPPDFEALAEEEIRRLRQENRLQDVSPDGVETVRRNLVDNYRAGWRSIPPGQARQFIFRNLRVDREQEGYLHLRFKPTHTGGLSDVAALVRLYCGDPEDPDTQMVPVELECLVDRFQTVPIPLAAVNREGVLYVLIALADRGFTVTFEGSDSLELLYGIGQFHWNLFCCLAILWCRLAFLAAGGLAASCFVSFPVACMALMLVLFASASGGFLMDAMEWVEPGTSGKADPMWVLGPPLRWIGRTFVRLVPDFSRYDAAGNVASGRLIPLVWTFQAVAYLVLVRGLILGVVASVILTLREVARPTA